MNSGLHELLVEEYDQELYSPVYRKCYICVDNHIYTCYFLVCKTVLNNG